MLAKEVCAIFNGEQYFLEDACMVGIHWNGFFAFSLLAGKLPAETEQAGVPV